MSEVKVIPLGTVAPYPKNDLNCPGYLVKDGKYNILLDCGNGSTRLLNMQQDLNNLKIFITHLHPDHIGDLASLLQTIKVYKQYGYVKGNTELYIPDTLESRVVNYTDDDGWGCSKHETVNSLDYEYIKKYAKEADIELQKTPSKINYDNLEIISKVVPHQLESYAFKVNTDNGTIVYSGDTGLNNDLRNFARNCDLFICESTFLRGQYRKEDGHLYAYEAAQIASDANVKKLLLTHFWPEIDKEKYVEEAKEIFSNTEAAKEGKQLVLRRK